MQLLIPIAAAGTLCDILITSSIFKYMWRSGFRRRRTTIQELAVVCINMGAFTCLVSVITGIMYLFQGSSYWVAAIGMIIGQSKYKTSNAIWTILTFNDVDYVNSMLAMYVHSVSRILST
ncbi:hypothetical protein JVU11DRAFT_6392 [Chiua virens]|nr:hypothetical protein JVU11DRAFT_6392 [Chiua virens]